MLKLLSSVLLVCTLLLSTQASAADTQVKTFQLQSRPAQEMIPILRPMVDPRGSITGTGFTLIVRSTPQNLDEIAELIRQLDAAPNNLLISVRRGSGASVVDRGAELSGQIEGNNGRVTVAPSGTVRGSGGATVEGGSEGTRGRVRVYRTEREGDENVSQRLRVLEGQWAKIQMGQEMPVPQRTITPYGVQESIQYKDVSSGFEVRPRVSGDRVMVDIRPFRARPAATGGGVIESEQIITTVSGRIGEWIELGGVSEESRSQRGGIVYSTGRSEQQDMRTYIKIDLVQ